MAYLGIDLAWNGRARTGLAMLDQHGALAGIASVVTDDEIDAWIAGQPPAGVIGVDAPVAVPNASGSRDCEKQIGAAFGRFDAGAYPANRGNPLFDPPRALSLARRHGWTVDPDSTQRPLALEVYPHPAMVGLFRLDRILPYKARPHRSLAQRRDAFVRLCDLLESIPSLRAPEHPEYAALRRAATDATRPGLLGVVEDQLDAIVCAHLAWLWEHERRALRVYGDAREGYIVAPPPPTWPPAPRVRRPRAGSPNRGPTPPAMTSDVWEITGRPVGDGAGGRAWARAVRESPGPAVPARGASWRIDLEFRIEPTMADSPDVALPRLVSATLDAWFGRTGHDATDAMNDADAAERLTHLSATRREVSEGEAAGATVRINVAEPPRRSG